MIKICVEHSRIIINDYEPGDCVPLEHFFSIFDPVRHEYNFLGIEYDEKTKKLYLPRGIDIPYIQGMFNCIPQLNKRHDPMDKLEPILLNSKPRNSDQQKAISFLLGQGKYYYTRNYSQLGLFLNMGKGKTYCSIAMMAFYRLRTMIMAPAINWLEQWKKSILNFTNIKPEEIFMIQGIASIHSLLNRGVYKYKVILASTSSLVAYGKKYGMDELENLFKQLRIGLRFIDEAHLHFEQNLTVDFHSNTYKTIYITATPSKSNDDENKIYKTCFKNVPSITLFHEDKDPHSDYYAFRYNSHPEAKDISYCRNKYGMDRNKYIKDYIITKENFYLMIRIVLEIILKRKGKGIIYIGVNNSGEKVKEWIEYNYNFLKGHIGIYNSTIKKDKEKMLNKKIIISTLKSCGTAMDIKGLSTNVNLAEPIQSEPNTLQWLGRPRDDGTICIECVDEGFKPLVRFYYNKKSIVTKYSKSTHETRFTDNELINANERIKDSLYNNGKFPKVYLENDKKMIMMRVQKEPFNEFKNNKRIIMKRNK